MHYSWHQVSPGGPISVYNNSGATGEMKERPTLLVLILEVLVLQHTSIILITSLLKLYFILVSISETVMVLVKAVQPGAFKTIYWLS